MAKCDTGCCCRKCSPATPRPTNTGLGVMVYMMTSKGIVVRRLNTPTDPACLCWDGTTVVWNEGSGSVAWGDITGTLSDQTDLQAALDAKQDAGNNLTQLGSSSTLGSGLVKVTGSLWSNAVSGTDYAPATSGSSILYGNGAGGFSLVTIGSGLSFGGGTLAATGGGGLVVSVQQATFSGVQDITTTNGSWTDVTSLTLNVTTTTATQQVLIEYNVCVGSQPANGSTALRCVRGGTAIGVGTVSGAKTSVGSNSYESGVAWINTQGWKFLDSPGAAGTYTYKVQCCSLAGGACNSYINYGENGTVDAGYVARGFSSLTAMLLDT